MILHEQRSVFKFKKLKIRERIILAFSGNKIGFFTRLVQFLTIKLKKIIEHKT